MSSDVEVGRSMSLMEALESRSKLAKENGQFVDLASSSDERQKSKKAKAKARSRSNSGSSSNTRRKRKKDKMLDPDMDTLRNLKDGDQITFSTNFLNQYEAYEYAKTRTNFKVISLSHAGKTFKYKENRSSDDDRPVARYLSRPTKGPWNTSADDADDDRPVVRF